MLTLTLTSNNGGDEGNTISKALGACYRHFSAEQMLDQEPGFPARLSLSTLAPDGSRLCLWVSVLPAWHSSRMRPLTGLSGMGRFYLYMSKTRRAGMGDDVYPNMRRMVISSPAGLHLNACNFSTSSRASRFGMIRACSASTLEVCEIYQGRDRFQPLTPIVLDSCFYVHTTICNRRQVGWRPQSPLFSRPPAIQDTQQA